MLADAPAGRLHKEIVETGKAAAVCPASLQLQDAGIFGFAAQVRAEQSVDTALDLLLAQVEKTAAKPITDAEVERARTQILKQIELSLNSSADIGLELSNWAGMGDWRLMFIHRDRLRAVKTADVQGVWSTYLKMSNRTAGIYYPTKTPIEPRFRRNQMSRRWFKTTKGMPCAPKARPSIRHPPTSRCAPSVRSCRVGSRSHCCPRRRAVARCSPRYRCASATSRP